MMTSKRKPKREGDTTTNFVSGTLWVGDNLPIMRGLNSESADMIYLDPPFNSNRMYEAPIGSEAAGAAFKDAWTLDDVDKHEHGELAERNPAAHAVIQVAQQMQDKSMMSYLIMMALRLMEMQRVLKKTGSIFLHCDPTASHYLKLLMDSIFGHHNFRNEIVWHYGGRGAKARSHQFPRNSDYILFYSKSDNYTYNRQHVDKRILFEGSGYQIDENGLCFRTAPRGDYTDESIENLRKENRIYTTRTGKIRVKYFADYDGTYVYEKKLVGNVWNDIPDAMHMSKDEYTGYPTQKPLALLERIVQASSKKGDMIFDPFCGCATALVAADRLERDWIGVDLSPKAAELVNLRIRKDRGPLFEGATVLEEPPMRTDTAYLPSYRTHRHRLYGEQEGVCAGCRTHFPFSVMDVDHMLPRSQGGTDHIENLQLLCSGCNRSKGNKTMAEWNAWKKDQKID